VAHADPQLEPVTTTHYAIDLYEGFALGSSALVAMGGAGAANAIGSSGTLINPSAPAVRQTTDNDAWSWDYHFDYLDGSLSTDYDNSQLVMPTGTSARVLTFGLALRRREWAAAATVTLQNEQVSSMAGGTAIAAQAVHSKLAIARWVSPLDISLGAALVVGSFDIQDTNTGAQLFTISGGGAEAGAQWLPSHHDFRFGAAFATPFSGENVKATCDPTSCDGYMLPEAVHAPWRAVIGGAYRFAGSSWNQQVSAPFRDEQAVTLVADLVATGSSPNAYGLQAFGQHLLERSGRHAAFSPRGGAEYEWLPGRLRVRAGSYWEPARFEGVDGRLHATFGVEARVLSFALWGPRRGRITLTGDVASRYRNVALSIGFWH
jgi:hypothetical protein